MLRATVSGSFHRHMPAVYAAVHELRAEGVDVLSPADPRVVDFIGEFLFVASDKLRSIKLVQDRHFEAIRRSDFLWVTSPDGYTGASTSAEIGAAHIAGIPVFSDHLPLDITLQHYVRKAPSIRAAVAVMRARHVAPVSSQPHFLIDPDEAINRLHAIGDRLRPIMAGLNGEKADEVEAKVANARENIISIFGESRSDR